MSINVTVSEITLSTVVDEIEASYDYEGDLVAEGRPVTIAHLVAGQIVERLTGDSERWDRLSRKFAAIRDEMIHEALRPVIEEAVCGPVRKTNTYGEPVGTETTTLRELIAAESRKILTQRTGEYNRNGETVISKIVSEEVHKAFAAEVKDAVKQAREKVAAEIGQQVAHAVAAAMRAR